MQVIRSWHNVMPAHHGCVASIGNFDGMHLGHQQLLKNLTLLSQQYQLPSQVLIFEPQPAEYFRQEKCPARLMRMREKIHALRQCGVDRLLINYFNKEFAQIPADKFVQDYLVKRLGIRHIIVGDDFRFGFNRLGHIDLLNLLGAQNGFIAETMPVFEVNGQRVSSTQIREFLATGNLAKARQFLGRNYRLSGRVAHGEKLGRTIGFPTANIHLRRLLSPIQGIFAVQVYGLKDKPVAGAASIGTRPTVKGEHVLLEVHLLDFDQDMYGQYIEVEFIEKIRDEQEFLSVEDMRLQIVEDVQRCRAVLSLNA